MNLRQQQEAHDVSRHPQRQLLPSLCIPKPLINGVLWLLHGMLEWGSTSNALAGDSCSVWWLAQTSISYMEDLQANG